MPLNEISFSSEELLELLAGAFSKKAALRFQTKGFSMVPFIMDNDVVTLSPFLGPPAHIGQAIAFLHPKTKKLVIHRVIGKKGARYLVKGDSLSKSDGLILPEDILGCVTGIERAGRNVFKDSALFRIAAAFISRIGILPLLFLFLRRLPLSVKRYLKCKILS